LPPIYLHLRLLPGRLRTQLGQPMIGGGCIKPARVQLQVSIRQLQRAVGK